MSSHDLFSGTSTRTCDLVASRQIALLFWRSPALFSFIYVLYTSSKRKVVINQT